MKWLLETGMEERRPLLLKLGVALAVPLAGYYVAHLRFPASAATVAVDESETSRKSGVTAPIGRGKSLKDGLLILQNEEDMVNIIHGTSTSTTTMSTTINNITEQSPKSLRKVNQESEQEPEKLDDKEEKMDAEIVHLSNLMQSLWDRNRSLETEMLEYYGLKEKGAVIRELQNQWKLNSLEAKGLTLKTESLKDENQRLKLQASEYSSITRELESARVKIKHLERRLMSVHVQAREKIASLEQRIRMLNDMEREDRQEDVDLQNKLKRLKDLEDEAAELRKENSILAQENLDFAQTLASAETSISTLEGPQGEVLEEVNQLREANDNLEKKIGQLQTDRCADAEEMVYLRWLNACLRHELRDHQPPPGQMIAKDLSKSSSPRSEEKAKQLILDYAHACSNGRNISFRDLDAQYSSQESNGESEDTISDDSFMTKDISSRRSKLLDRLKKPVLSKGGDSFDKIPAVTPSSRATSERRASVSTRSLDDATRRNSFDSVASCFTEEHPLSSHLAGRDAHADDRRKNKSPWFRSGFSSHFNVPGARRGVHFEAEGKAARCKSDLGTSFNYRRRASGDQGSFRLGEPENVQIKKYAEALMSSRASPELKRRSASFSYS